MKNVTFPELRACIAKYGLTYEELSNLIGVAKSTFCCKMLNKKSTFNFPELLKLRTLFVELGEDPNELTMQRLFFDWVIHNSENKEQGV